MIRGLDHLLHRPQPRPQFEPADVTSVDPLKIRVLTSTVEELVLSYWATPYKVNQRVWVTRIGQQVIIAGIHGGPIGGSVNGLDMNDVTETGIYTGYNMTNGVPGMGISGFEVIKYSPDWIIQKQYPINATPWADMWIRSRYNGTTWSAWQKQGTGGPRGGILFNLPPAAYPPSGVLPIVGFTASPYQTWGDTSWRTSPTDSSACFINAGVYRLDCVLFFVVSGDSYATAFGGTVRHSGGRVRPEVLSLGGPTNRFLPRITGVGISHAIYNTLTTPTAVSVTNVYGQFSVERIAD